MEREEKARKRDLAVFTGSGENPRLVPMTRGGPQPRQAIRVKNHVSKSRIVLFVSITRSIAWPS